MVLQQSWHILPSDCFSSHLQTSGSCSCRLLSMLMFPHVSRQRDTRRQKEDITTLMLITLLLRYKRKCSQSDYSFTKGRHVFFTNKKNHAYFRANVFPDVLKELSCHFDHTWVQIPPDSVTSQCTTAVDRLVDNCSFFYWLFLFLISGPKQ